MTNSNSYLRLKDYMQHLATQHTAIQAFAGYSNRDLLTQVASRDGIASPYLALFDYKLSLFGPEQRTVATRKLGFAIMLNQVNTNDFQAQYTAIDQAETIALQIIARIRYDNNQKNHFLWNAFIKESVKINPVELSANSYGVEVFIHFKNPQALSLQPDNWKDVDTVC